MRTFDAMIARTKTFEDVHGAGSIYHIDYKALTAGTISSGMIWR